MAENLLSGFSKIIVPSNTVTASGSTAAITLAAADSYAFVLNVTAASGTTETLDMAIQVFDGTTWFDWWRFAQVTTSTVTRRLVVQPIQGRGEAGTEAAITAAASGALNANAPLGGLNNQIRFTYTISGTSPSYTFAVSVFAQPRATAV